MVSGAVTSAGSATSYTSLMNFARVGAVVLGYLAGSSLAAERGREVRKKLEHELQQKEAELQRLRHEQAAVGGRITSTGDPVQDWLQSLPSS
ncbi:hypothetical protein CCYA_CCYA18G4538 [Cyanidiococcus yangmingshanensis]|nr:hypothetical protein CCYA_CCYA18G4538 [Cyanidiococcus yangmingshanensis]